MKTYYSMLVREGLSGPWRVEFGDWDQETVADERREYLEPDGMYRREDVKIIITDGRQSSIDAAVSELNQKGWL